MKNTNDINHFQLVSIIKEGSLLPEQIFNCTFRDYLFFDADICTSMNMVCELRDLVRQLFGVEFDVVAFSSVEQKYLGRFDENKSWENEISTISKKLKDEDNYTGLILFDASMNWILHQNIPGELGVLALNSPEDGLSRRNSDYFLTLEDIEHYVKTNKSKDHSVQLHFFGSLLRNYGKLPSSIGNT